MPAASAFQLVNAAAKPSGAPMEDHPCRSSQPVLWFDGRPKRPPSSTPAPPEARSTRSRGTADDPAGRGRRPDVQLHGQPSSGFNGGPDFNFNEAASLAIDSEDQAEIDRYWDALVENGGEPGPCGWLKDRFGLSWQIVPALKDLLTDPTPPGRTRHAGDAADGEARRRRAPGRVRGQKGRSNASPRLESAAVVEDRPFGRLRHARGPLLPAPPAGDPRLKIEQLFLGDDTEPAAGGRRRAEGACWTGSPRRGPPLPTWPTAGAPAT